ncbi:DUF742 domain-containing protein [Amycolatopsis sp. K13G38]|uniref:DUF742 domain-containing protein n=1 Tax=Amycolatopsis acididurans TaxID=2724524 RepID=A0ABX1J102_9PSEU|nr:DUF742 domain-containing protein [Amycolatopsis acididurans]NKQ53081.1 DUF742 domain-containing protein [Amycolatopsis acididurans]
MSTGSGSGSPPAGDDDATFADVLNGFSLDSGRARRKRRKAKQAEPEAARPQQQPEVQEQAPPPAAEPAEPTQGLPGFAEPGQGTGLFEPAVSSSGPMLPERPDYGGFDEETAVVRPYALTGGRTKASYALELETLISVDDAVAARIDAGMTVQFEHRSIMEECRKPRSVAELAAVLRVPIGVARVLISDAADAGLVTVHRTVSGNDDAEAHLMLMERVLSGLRRL